MTETESAILAHARRCAPAESCGFVVRTSEGERYFPCVNISGEPEDYFRMSPEDWLRAEMQGEIVALVHSHPGGLPWLSEADRRLQVQSDLPWWLVCRGAIHKFRCVPHLTGRRFEHGVTDCYTLFRDAYHLAGIEMPDFHREDDWWRNDQNLYLDNLEATGLYQVPLSSAQPGDVLLCCFGSSVPNHAAIYCGDGELLHHIPEQLSKRERYTDKWQRRTMVTGMAEDLQSLVGGTVVRRKVYARFLDAVNFVNGNSDADPEQEVISRWRIEQCSELSAVSASFVLSTPTETDGAVFPGRIMLANTCTWTYRGDECGYNGPAVADEYDQPTSDITKDKCSKCLSGCKFRNNVGNFGGFLSINKLSQ
ncbi:phage minor tail protein L [Escherichia coli]|nr:phage minor tail protein L [Escherichia coli]